MATGTPPQAVADWKDVEPDDWKDVPSGSVADRHNNPLNIKLGPLTKRYVDEGSAKVGESATDGGQFLRFESPDDGYAAAHNLLLSPAYKDLPVGAAMKKWSSGGYGASVAPALSPFAKISDLSLEDRQGLIEAMAKREGYSGAAPTESSEDWKDVSSTDTGSHFSRQAMDQSARTDAFARSIKPSTSQPPSFAETAAKLQEPISKRILGFSLSDVADKYFPEKPPKPATGYAADSGTVPVAPVGGREAVRHTAKTVAGFMDFMQSPEALAAALAEAVTAGGATPVIASLMGAQFATQGGKEAVHALNDMKTNGVTPENSEQFFGGLAVGAGALIGPAAVREGNIRAKAAAAKALAEKDKIHDIVTNALQDHLTEAGKPTPEPQVATGAIESQPDLAGAEPKINSELTRTEPNQPELGDWKDTTPAEEKATSSPGASPFPSPEGQISLSDDDYLEMADRAAEKGEKPPVIPEGGKEPEIAAEAPPVKENEAEKLPLLAAVDQLKEAPIRAKEPEVVRDSEFQAYAGTIRSLAERNLPEVTKDVDAAIELYDSGKPGEAMTKLEIARQELHGAGKRLAEAAAKKAGVELPEDFGQDATPAAATPPHAGNELPVSEAQPAEDTARAPENTGSAVPVSADNEPPMTRDQIIDNGAEYEMDNWAAAVRDAQDQLKRGESAQSVESSAAGKEIEEQAGARASAIRSLGAKEGSPLAKFLESPDELAKAIEDRGGKKVGSKKYALYQAIRKAFRDAYEEIHGEDIDRLTASQPDKVHDEEDLTFDFGSNVRDKLDDAISRSDAKISQMFRDAANGRRLGANIPFEIALEMVKNGALRIARGTANFTDWTKEMREKYGDKLSEEFLRGIYGMAIDRVRELRDSGSDGARAEAILSGSYASGNRYVRSDPFVVRSGLNDRSVTKNLREEFAGLKNAQTVRGNQFVDAIKKSIPDKLEREAMFWYKAARGDEGAIRQAISEEEFAPYKAQLEKALSLSPKAQSLLQEIGRYYTEAGQVSRDVGTISNVREEYQNRIYKPRKTGDYVKNELGGGVKPFTRHALRRVYETEFDAVRGGKQFATTDIADSLGIHNEELARANASRKLADAMKDSGVGAWVKPGKMADGWKQVGTLERRILIRDEAGNARLDSEGQPIYNHTVFAAPEGIAKGLRAVTDPNFLKKIEGYKFIQKYQGLVKTVDLSYSFFHHFTMGMQTLYQGGWKALTELPTMSKVIDRPEFHEMEQDFARNGGMTTKIDANHDILRSLVEHTDPDWLSKLSKLPGVREAVSRTDRQANFLFGKMQRMLKVQDYAGKVANWIGDHPEATNTEISTIKRQYAKQVNSVYGGLNWEALGVTKTALAGYRLLLLAPDWTISNGHLVVQAVGRGQGVAGTAARAHYLRAVLAGIVLTEGTNKLMTGHFTDQNPKGHQSEVEIAPGVWVSFMRGGVGDVLKAGSMIEQSGLKGASQFAQGKLSPFVRTAVGMLSNIEYTGHPIAGPKSKSPTLDYLGYLARSAGPVPFGAGNLYRYSQDRQATGLGALAVGTGIGRYAPAKRR